MIVWWLPPEASSEDAGEFITGTRRLIAAIDAELRREQQREDAARDMLAVIEAELASPEPDVMRLLAVTHRAGDG